MNKNNIDRRLSIAPMMDNTYSSYLSIS